MNDNASSENAMPPFSESDSALLEWLTLIGFLSMNWTPIERSIDQCVHLIYTQFDGKNIIGKKPQHLNQKFDFLIDGFNKIPVLKIKHHDVINLVATTKPTASKRNIFVHGVIEKWSKEQITISKVKKDEHHLKEMFAIDLNMLNPVASNMSVLANQWHALASFVLSLTTQSR